MNASKKLTIFEGPDGSGKTTAAKTYAEVTNAKYVHFPALPRVTHGLARMYAEAMLPAVLGYQNVVFDRSWLSETPYGVAFREGQDRLTQSCRRMLERLAYRCGGVVAMCLPQWETVRSNFMRRKHLEMLADDVQLRRVYNMYTTQHTSLPCISYDFENVSQEIFYERLEWARSPCHDTNLASAGNWGAGFVIVGENFAERKDQDPWYQWPFASFSGDGCSRWLTEQLEKAKFGEDNFLWVNADQDLKFIRDLEWAPSILALGSKAKEALNKEEIEAHTFQHPQFWKRFNSKEVYPLIEFIGDTYE